MQNNDALDTTDMVIYKNAGGYTAGGFKLETILGSSFMKGGGVSKNGYFKDLGVPAGLLIQQDKNIKQYPKIDKGDMVDDVLYEKLLSLAEDKPHVGGSSKTTKRRKKPPSRHKKTKKTA